MRKYFDFNGTISGGQYIGRAFVSTFVYGLICGLVTGSSANYQASLDAAAVINFVLIIPLAWFNLSNTNKRLNAVMSKEKTLGWVLCLIPYVSFIMNLYLIFKNSNIKKHNG